MNVTVGITMEYVFICHGDVWAPGNFSAAIKKARTYATQDYLWQLCIHPADFGRKPPTPPPDMEAEVPDDPQQEVTLCGATVALDPNIIRGSFHIVARGPTKASGGFSAGPDGHIHPGRGVVVM